MNHWEFCPNMFLIEFWFIIKVIRNKNINCLIIQLCTHLLYTYINHIFTLSGNPIIINKVLFLHALCYAMNP